jgi:hypothetical protein
MSTFDKPSQVILKILLSYMVVCTFCRKPFSMKEIQNHEPACERSKCSNELCGLAMDTVPSIVKFTVAGEERVACCKKCKKVTKFAIMLKKASEGEVLRAFEGMLRKKQSKHGGLP